jgi:hypothetical protein
LNSTERLAVPLLIVQTTSVVFLWSLDTLNQVSQTIFTLFLAADLLAFALVAHVYMTSKNDSTARGTTLVVWGLAVMALFVAGLFVS